MVKPVGLKVNLPLPADDIQTNQEIIIKKDNKNVIKGIFWAFVAYKFGGATLGTAGATLAALRYVEPTTYFILAGVTISLGYFALQSCKNAYYHFTPSK